MTNQAAQTMPELPAHRGYLYLHNTGGVSQVYGYTADQMHQYARDYAAALSQTAGVHEPGRYFAGGPQGHFFADDLQLARDLVNLYDKDDDWTITDLRNPTGAAPAASGGEDGWKRMTAEARAIQMRHLDDHQGDVYHAMQSLVVKHGYRSTEPMMQPIEPKPPSAAPASGIHPDALPDGTLSKSTAKRVEVLGAASVSERARELLAAEYEAEGWMTEAGACRRGSLDHADRFAMRAIGKTIEQGDEDGHVITELGRLLAGIAVILKGPEPAGTAWSYHDLPDMVQALTQQRVECWPLNKNPKDGWTFDPSFLYEVKTRAEQSDIGEFAPCLEGVESVLIALRGMGDTTPQPSADAVRELVKRWRTGAILCTRQDYDDGARDALNECADELESLLSGVSNA